MKQNSHCYGCVYCQTCDKENEEKCSKQNYILFTTDAQMELCELMGCGEVEEDDCD